MQWRFRCSFVTHLFLTTCPKNRPVFLLQLALTLHLTLHPVHSRFALMKTHN